MKRKLIIDGNAVYEIDEDCMLKKHADQETKESKEETGNEHQNQVRP